jgi:aminomethyltransferase
MPAIDSATTRKLPLRDLHRDLGARFGEFSGWEMPLWYGGAIEEHLAVRHAAGIFDISHMGRISVEGPAAGDALGSVFTRKPSTLADGGSAYAFLCNEQGGIVDDLIYYRRAENSYLVVCNAANSDKVLQSILDSAADKAIEVRDIRAVGTALLAVQGPAAVTALAGVLGSGVREIPRRASAGISINGREFFLGRTGYTGEDGFELLCWATDGAWLLDQLVAAGVTPCGLAARDTLRLEASLPLHGHDIDETTNPYEAGLGWAVDLEHRFRGRDEIEAAKENVKRRLAYLVADGPGVFRPGCAVFYGDEQVGVLTSGGPSPMLGESVAMGYLPRPLAREGTELSVDVRGRRIAAHTVKRPFYTAGNQPD